MLLKELLLNKMFAQIIKIYVVKSFSNFIIQKNNLIKNIKNFKHFKPNVKICAVVKANAYGMGMNTICKIVYNLVDFFGVACAKEALKLRKITKKPILILGSVCEKNILICLKNKISLTVSSLKELNEILVVAEKNNLIANVHFKINSGMNRLGFANEEEYRKALDVIFNNCSLFLEGVYTHFADVNNKDRTEKQYLKFKKFLSYGKSKDTIVHAASSNFALLNDKYCFDMVRLGILMYGYAETKPPFELLPICKITSKIVKIQNVSADDFVGYGSGFFAKRNLKVAVVPIGYADGFLKCYAGKAQIIIKNKKCFVIAVCMDMIVVNITNINCDEGDEVIILGESKNQKITAEDYALWGKSIPYEVLTSLKIERFNYLIV